MKTILRKSLFQFQEKEEFKAISISDILFGAKSNNDKAEVVDEILKKLDTEGKVEVEYVPNCNDPIKYYTYGRIALNYLSDSTKIWEFSFIDEQFYRELSNHTTLQKSKGRNFIGKAFIKDATIKDGVAEFIVELLIPWEDEDIIDNLRTANEEATRIIREARKKARSERKVILEQTAIECAEIKEQTNKIFTDKKRRIDNFLSAVLPKAGDAEKKELLHSLCLYMNYEQEPPIIYTDEKEYKDKIKSIKSNIRFYQKNEWELTRYHQKGLPEFVRSYSDLYKIKKNFSDYFNMTANIIIEELKTPGTYKTYCRISDFSDNLNEILGIYNLKIDDNYLKEWIDLIYAIENLNNYRKQKKLEDNERREREREEVKAQREYERAIKQAEKDEATARRKIKEAQKKLEEQKNNEKKYKELTEQIEKLQQALQDAIQRGERALSMAQQTKKGFVYIISNEESFGENVYKIGLTRRLDPTERIDELSNASVPFPFSIYIIIESDDAPALEAHLHRKFDEQKINKTNWRKEFFRISREDIDKALEEENIIVMNKDKDKYV